VIGGEQADAAMQLLQPPPPPFFLLKKKKQSHLAKLAANRYQSARGVVGQGQLAVPFVILAHR
jgi:hypothetical protein